MSDIDEIPVFAQNDINPRNSIVERVEDAIAGYPPHQVIPAFELVMRGRSLLETDAWHRRLWKRAAAALGRVKRGTDEVKGGSR
jgi:hypothetical protein